MISLIDVNDVIEKARANFRSRRLELKLTQAGLAKRSGVKLPTLRKFERTGKISFESLLNLALVLDYLDKLAQSFDPISPPYKTIQEVIKASEKQPPKRGQIT